MNAIRMMCWATPLVAVVLASTAGCAHYSDYSAFLREPRPEVTSTAYLLAPPDQVIIISKTVREINGHRETIRPDGKITLPLLGSVFVAGRTVEDVSAQLQELSREFYEDADVSARVSAFRSKKVFVFGEVATPGPYTYDGANTVLETLAMAQPSRLADPARIHVLRPHADGDVRKRMTIDLNKMIKEGDTTLDAVLEEGDIIYVPANPLATVGLALQQLLLPIQPAAATVSGPGNIAGDVRGRPYNDNPDADTN